MIERWPSSRFHYDEWCNGSLHTLGCYHRYWSIAENKHIIKKYAIAWCKAEHLFFKPKLNEIAIMFFYNGLHFWCHITIREFKYSFPEIKF
jgi:hypothetical protein